MGLEKDTGTQNRDNWKAPGEKMGCLWSRGDEIQKCDRFKMILLVVLIIWLFKVVLHLESANCICKYDYSNTSY